MSDVRELWTGPPSWLAAQGASFSQARQAAIGRYEADLAHQLRNKPKRLAHSLSVGHVAERLALAYGEDPYLARVAGILHDWSKALSHAEVIEHARGCGIDLGVELSLVEPLLHGMVAAAELPARYPELPREVWQAISRHTLGDAHMAPLDMLLFVADGIEPRRSPAPAIERQRSHAGKVALADLFWESFADGVSYVIDTRRYLYPGTLAIYNELALARAQEAV